MFSLQIYSKYYFNSHLTMTRYIIPGITDDVRRATEVAELNKRRKFARTEGGMLCYDEYEYGRTNLRTNTTEEG